MFGNDTLKEHLQTQSVINLESFVVAEWNMNVAENILQIGNYRYRPADSSDSTYRFLAQSFSLDDSGGNFYTGATDSDIILDGGFTDDNVPIAFISKKEKQKLLYSLEDCFGKFRPRSGINKAVYSEYSYLNYSNKDIYKRPRYYMADKNDVFKYWTSFRWDGQNKRGIANNDINGQYFIEDAAPYVVYKDTVPANRLVVKMQTNVGEVDLGPFKNVAGDFNDPFYGEENQTTPIRWKIQYLEGDNWIDAISFDQNSRRVGDRPVVGSDGYVEVVYGLIVPEKYRNDFYFVKEYSSSTMLPPAEEYSDGAAFLIGATDTNPGQYKIVYNGGYNTFDAKYGWYLFEEGQNPNLGYVKELTDLPRFSDAAKKTRYREFSYIRGIRVVAETMNKFDASLDIIEISPRLTVDLTDKVSGFSVTKPASDIGVSGMPVGQLLAASGDINIFDYDQAFFPENTNSLVSGYVSQHVQFKLYEKILNVSGDVTETVPIKTLYSEGFPQISSTDRSVSIACRDLYFYFESLTAPEILLTDVSLSFATAMLLDSIGFANYKFLSNEDEPDDIIPFFFISPDKSVAEVLNDLAIATQSAMFFDEENNFIVMSKNYIMPTVNERSTDIVLYGSKDSQKSGVYRNDTIGNISNIKEISLKDTEVYNDGVINYTSRYIQRSYAGIQQATMLSKEKTWVYKQALLWEVAPTENIVSENEEMSQQSAYVLAAIPLNSDLTDQVPQVVQNRLVNNIMDLGDGVYYIARYNGYFYANGEIIKYDAVQYSIPGLSETTTDPNVENDNVWISSVRDYQKYFAKIPFNGKMYPTGLVRIYAEPNYEEVNGVSKLKNGAVAKHGRKQFGTGIQDSDGNMLPVYHYAGLSSHWTSPANRGGCLMDSSILLSIEDQELSVSLTGEAAGVDDADFRFATEVSGVVKNLLATEYREENGSNNDYSSMVQASALVMKGSNSKAEAHVPDPNNNQTMNYENANFVSYVHKNFSNKFRHFGTRMRIIGKTEYNDIIGQTAAGATTYATNPNSTVDEPVSITGGSGGLAVLLNPSTNSGYYFELMALTENNNSGLGDMTFYKIARGTDAESEYSPAIPVRLWAGNMGVQVDSGNFVAQQRLFAEETPTVYDIAVEFESISENGGLRFYLYVNGTMIAIVDDPNPLPIYNNMALFVRGASQCAFENLYALAQNYSKNTGYGIDTDVTPANSALKFEDITATSALQKYAMSGLIQSTYLSGISSSDTPEYNMYFEEFGTIMRECAYFDIKYDKAYPALYAQLSPTINKVRGYTVSGFNAGSYGAQFLVFNSTDAPLNLDSTSGNYLRIQGITFTQQSENQLTVDDFYQNVNNFANVDFSGDVTIRQPNTLEKAFNDIKVSRISNGKKAFSLSSPYIQSQDSAENIMSWFTTKIMKKRRSVGVTLFGLPTLQLGDIVEIDYTNENGVQEIAANDSRFVVYHIEYGRGSTGLEMQAYLSEVV